MKSLIIGLVTFALFTSELVLAQDTARWIFVEAGYSPLVLFDQAPKRTYGNKKFKYSPWPTQIQVLLKPVKKLNFFFGGGYQLLAHEYPPRPDSSNDILPWKDSTVFIRNFRSKMISVGYLIRHKRFLFLPTVHVAHRNGWEWVYIMDKPFSGFEGIVADKELNSYGTGFGFEAVWVVYQPFTISAALQYTHYWEKDGLWNWWDQQGDEPTGYFKNYIPNKNALVGSVSVGLYLDKIPFFKKEE